MPLATQYATNVLAKRRLAATAMTAADVEELAHAERIAIKGSTSDLLMPILPSCPRVR